MTPHRNCRLKLLKLERIKDFLLLEEEFIQNQERLKPQEEKNEVHTSSLLLEAYIYSTVAYRSTLSAPCSQHFVILFSLLIPVLSLY